MRARFTGRDGSVGYRKGHVYDLAVQVDRWSGVVKIRSPRPVPYLSWDAFWENWEHVPSPAPSPSVPRQLDEAAVAAYLERATAAGRNGTEFVTLEPLQSAWRPDGGYFIGPGVVHYWRLRDDGTIGASWVDTATVDQVISGAVL